MTPSAMMSLIVALTLVNLGAIATTAVIVEDRLADDTKDGGAPVPVQTVSLEDATAIYLRIEGIEGESDDADHDKWIDVLAWSHEISLPRDPATGAPSGEVGSGSVVLVKEIDKASPKLAEKLASGETMHVEFEMFSGRTGEEMALTMSGTLVNATVAKVQTGEYALTVDSDGDGALDRAVTVLSEEVAFDFEEIEWTYAAGPQLASTFSMTTGIGGSPTMATLDIFLDMDGIEGESTDSGHEGEIEVMSWSWGETQQGRSALGGMGAGKVSVQDLSITKEYDKSSPLLAKAMANGEHIKDAVIVVRRNMNDGSPPTDFMIIELEDLLVTGIVPVDDPPVLERTFVVPHVLEASGPMSSQSRGTFVVPHVLERVHLSFVTGNVTYPGASIEGTDIVLDLVPLSEPPSNTTRLYLMIDGIAGDVTDEGREGSIALEGISMDIFDPANAPVVERSTPVIIQKRIDKSSPLLAKALREGTTLNGTIYVDDIRSLENGSVERTPYLRYVLKNVLVSSMSTGGTAGEDRLTESISFNFEEIEATYLETGLSFVEAWKEPSEETVEAFLEIEGIPGESTDKGHEEWIEVHSWSWGMSQPGTLAGGSGGTGKVSMQDLSFTKMLDKSSPKLAEACAKGEHIKDAKLVLRRDRGDGTVPVTFLVIELEDLLITGIAPVDPPAGHERTFVLPHVLEKDYERVDISFVAGNMTYPQASDEGTDIVLGLVPWADPASITTRYYMMIEGFTGDVTEERRRGTVTVEDISFDAGSAMAGAGSQPISIRKRINKSSPLLASALRDGSSFNATIYVDEVRALTNGSTIRTPYLRYELEDVVVSSYSTGVDEDCDGTDDDCDRLTESISLNYAKITTTYPETDVSYVETWEAPDELKYSTDAFLHIDGIPGEATDEAHKGEIEVLSWSWGMSQTGTHGSGGGAGKVNVQDISITKYVDKATPLLMQAMANGEHIRDVKLTIRRTNSAPQFLTMSLANATILTMVPEEKVYLVAGLERPATHIETITIRPERIEMTYLDPALSEQAVVVELLPALVEVTNWTEMTMEVEGLAVNGTLVGPIELDGFEHEATLMASEYGTGNGTRMHRPITIRKAIDRSSPLLQQAMADGTTMNVTISLDRVSSDGSRTTYFRYNLFEAWPVAIGSQGSDGVDDVPTESISFNYQKIEWEYVELGIEYEETGVFVEPEVDAAAVYMEIKGIEGEATDEGHEGWIDILSMEWGIEAPPRDAASGLPTGKRQHSPIVIQKELDKSSPKLAQALSSGSPLTVSLEVHRTDDNGATVHYLTINLTGAVVQSMDLDHRGHVTVLKAAEEVTSSRYAIILMKAFDDGSAEIETSVFRWSTMEVTFEETGEVYRETWEPPAAVPNVTAFMHVEDIEGASIDDGHSGWMDLDSFSWGLEEYIEEATGMPTGMLVASDVTVTKGADKSSPALAMLIASGIKVNVTIEQWALNSSAPLGMDHVLTLVLHNASVMSIRSGGVSDVCAPCTYDIVLSFETLDVVWELYGVEREGIRNA